MRINKYVASATGLSRRKVDQLIETGKISVNSRPAHPGQEVIDSDTVTMDGKVLRAQTITTILLHKPVSYVCSRDGQGSKTVYDLLPPQYHHLKTVGRLDKDSSGLLLLTNNGTLAHQLTHPSFEKKKVYIVTVKPQLTDRDARKVEQGIQLEDGLSTLHLQQIGNQWQVSMNEGRNRQIRRTFAALDYKVTSLKRIEFGDYHLGDLEVGHYRVLK